MMYHSKIEQGSNTNIKKLETSVQVLVLGGKENSLSVVRHLTSHGIKVSCSGPPDCWGMNSRYCDQRFPVPSSIDPKAFWFELLLGANSTQPRGQIILQGSDLAIEFVAEHFDALNQRYLLEGGSAKQRLSMLDKQTTLELAKKSGIGTPRFWNIVNSADLKNIRDQITYPVMVKPRNTARFARDLGRKLFIIENSFADLEHKVALSLNAGHPIMVVEMIPGPDSLLSSYYTYMNDDGDALFHFTKTVLRRFPLNRGGATFHATKWLPDTAKEGLKFFSNSGFRGLGNIEFKLDERDGRLKIIEVNARLTAAEELATKSGMPIDLIVYCHLTGQSIPATSQYQNDLHYLYFFRDILAFLQLWRKGKLSLRAWLKSITSVKSVSPLHLISDPWPSIIAAVTITKKAFSR